MPRAWRHRSSIVPRVTASADRCSWLARLQARDAAKQQCGHDRGDNGKDHDRDVETDVAQRRHSAWFQARARPAPAPPATRAARQAAPPANASTRPSISTCEARRVHAAPSAVRTAISCRRPSDRASSRLPTLTHAISSTKPTAASRSSNGRLVSPTSASRNGSTKYCEPRFWSGYSSLELASRACRIRRARWPTVCPWRRRPRREDPSALRCAGGVAG